MKKEISRKEDIDWKMSSNINRIIIYWLLIVLSLLNNPLSLVIWDAKCVSILIFGKNKLKIGKAEIRGAQSKKL